VKGSAVRWFDERGWKPFAFQRAVWKNHREGRQGLIHAATGTGKTYAAWFAALQGMPPGDQLRVLWITPLRALAADTLASLREPVADLKLDWTVEARTGDTPTAARRKQQLRSPNALVTTPESLSVMLSYEDARVRFSGLRMVVVDEWHEQLGSKRGVQTELALARLRGWAPGMRTWGLSATIGNLDEALRVLLGSEAKSGVIVEGRQPKKIRIDSLLPETMDRFPWAGHLGAHLLPQVARELEQAKSTLVFTNTRSQAETWYQMLLEAFPDLAGQMALHHGSMSRESRDWVESQLRQGALRCVVCTSSLDLGVDFTAVDRVIQIGSPKGVARLLQRAGRSGHQPGGLSRATVVPAHAFELVEACAAREAIAAGHLESRLPLQKPLDVLTQHMVTVGCGEGFEAEELLSEVRRTYAYRNLTAAQWDWAMAFVSRGGTALGAYPDYHKLIQDEAGRWLAADAAVVRRHRMNIGTITGDNSLKVQYMSGPVLGHMEETFLAGLQPGQAFVFSGKLLELVMLRDMTAWVKPTQGVKGIVPRWMGSRMPLSSLLSAEVRRKLEEARDGQLKGAEMRAIRPVLETQRQLSAIPGMDELLVETLQLRDGFHVFLYPFEGLLAHEGLATLLAYRLTRLRPQSITTTATDYGVELLSEDPIAIEEAIAESLFTPEGLEEDIAGSVNAAELSRRQFRGIARVAGLTFQGYPGQGKTARQVQATSGLIYDVLARLDPGNLLVEQARLEAMEVGLEAGRLRTTLGRMAASRTVLIRLERPSPLAFPLIADRIRGSAVSSEKLLDRIRKMQQKLEKSAS
jgi:ATP-dependent Lhr-like helicase